MTYNLSTLLDDLEADAGLEKKAGVDDKVTPAISTELASILEKKGSDDVSAQAYAEGEALAKHLLEKMANEIAVDNAAMQANDNQKITSNPGGTINQNFEGLVSNGIARGGESDDLVGKLNKQAEDEEAMIKEAYEIGYELADEILEKLAQDFGDVSNPAAGISSQAAAAPNLIQQDLDTMTAQHDAIVGTVPVPEDGTVNQLFEAIVDKAKAQGDVSDDLVNGPTGSTEPGERDLGQVGEPGSDEQEKAAAVAALTDSGVSFDDAVELVKLAEEEIQMDQLSIIKQAAVEGLVARGVDFDDAVELVKIAGGARAAASAAKKFKYDYKSTYNKARTGATEAVQKALNFGRDAKIRLANEAGDLVSTAKSVLTGRSNKGGIRAMIVVQIK